MLPIWRSHPVVDTAAPPPTLAEPVAVPATGGLRSDEAAARLAADGPNVVGGRPPRPAWLRFVDQFRNLLVAVLLGAAVLAFVVTGELKDPVVIGAVVLANATLGFVQERRAERSLAALRGMLADTARVRRDGRTVELPVAEVVVGDVVLVQTGDRIPADGHWLAAHELEVDESALTGESVPAAKITGPRHRRTHRSATVTPPATCRARWYAAAASCASPPRGCARRSGASPHCSTPPSPRPARSSARSTTSPGG